jgi:hypothetical protein
MTSMIRAAHRAAIVTLAALVVSYAGRNAHAQAIDLGNLGINWNFELPELPHVNTAEATSQGNLGPGWTLEVLAGNVSDQGVQDPNQTFYGPFVGPAPGTLPAPFEGRQLGYMNLNDDNASKGQIVSNSVGGLLAGQTYTLNVAVGARATDDWANVMYDIGLRTVGGVELGTFTTSTLDPAVATPTNIADLNYTLNVNAQAAAFVGQEVRIVIRGSNVGGGPSAPDFVQANFDNVRLSGAFSAPNRPLITINRDNGAVTLSKTGGSTFNIAGYQLASDTYGSFDQSLWTKISVAYDDSGNGSVDVNNDWEVLSAPGALDDLSEAEFEGGDGGTLTSGGPIALGTPWIQTPYQDVVATLLLADGTEIATTVQYTGAAVTPGDLNADGNINQADWTAFKAGQGANFTGMSIAKAYGFGDLNQDLKHDLKDFAAFRTAYDDFNGVGAFHAMAAAVPEPATGMLVAVGFVALGFQANRRRRSVRPRRWWLAAALAVLALSSVSDRTLAQSAVAHWTFDTPSITTDASGILTAADTTGLHNATRTNAAAGPLPINSVAGQFGQAAQFMNVLNEDATGASRLQIPNLTEIMGPAAGDFTVTTWANVPVGVTGQDNTILSDWSATNTYWFLLDNSSATTARPRGQIRNTTGADIIATTLSQAQVQTAVPSGSVADGQWHHYAWVWSKGPGTMKFYIDGIDVATVTTAQAVKDLRASTNVNAHIGWKQDSNDHFSGTLDELWVINGALTTQQVNNVKSTNTIGGITLTLVYDPASGQMQIKNNQAMPLAISSYEITSTAGGLDLAGWSRISAQNIAGFPVGNGSGNGWEAGPASSDNELSEWFLSGSSTLAPSAGIGLGAAYDDVQDATDLAFQYTTDTGVLVTGNVVSGTITAPSNPADFNNDTFVNGADLTILKTNFGSTAATKLTGDANGDGRTDGRDFLVWQRYVGATSSVVAGSPVPEPTAGLLFALACTAIVLQRKKFRQIDVRVSSRTGAAAVLAVAVAASTANAAFTLDRNYRMGDDPAEGASPGAPPIVTFDSQGAPSTGTYHDLSPFGGGPLYVNVASGPLARPGADGTLGLQFDGVDDFLSGLAFNRPSTTPSSTGGGGPLDYTGLSNRGFQLWVRPESAGLEDQSVVRDTDDHGVMIEADGAAAPRTWRLRYDEATINSGVEVTYNQWAHIMVVRPFGAAAPTGGAILYLNGVAIAADVGDYGAAPADGENDLRVGGALGATSGAFFKGTLDSLEMFVLGRTNSGIDRGTFNFATDNKFAAADLTGVAGDVNQDGQLSPADVDAFIDGWKSEKRVNNVRVGDLTTILDGDLNFDGITNLRDAGLLRSALAAAGMPALNLSALAVPEPSSIALALAALGVLRTRRRPTRGATQ